MQIGFFLDVVTDIEWWGGILYEIMLLLPPLEWNSEPEIYNKYAIYIGLPILILFLFHMFVFAIKRRGKKENRVVQIVKAAPDSITCKYCGHLPFPQPTNGVFYCEKCGKSNRV